MTPAVSAPSFIHPAPARSGHEYLVGTKRRVEAHDINSRCPYAMPCTSRKLLRNSAALALG